MLLFASLRERLDSAEVPQPFRGPAIALLTAGMMSLAFLGFSRTDPRLSADGNWAPACLSHLPWSSAHCWRALRHSLQPDDSAEIERINALLPQTQCGQCGYPGCRPYAEALLLGTAEIDQCPPGGASHRACTRRAARQTQHRAHASRCGSRCRHHRRALCIGCTRCVEVCPVDAIIGAATFSHTVIAADCTGCELCIPVCPVDCIRMHINIAGT
jgi:electron transport complex protein RnfB